MNEPQPLTNAIAAERCAVDTLREVADALAALPRRHKVQAITRLTPPLVELTKVAVLLRLRPTARPSGGHNGTRA